MKIDSHQHFWKYNHRDYGWMGDNMSIIKRDFLPLDLLDALATVKFDGSVAVQARQSLEETQWLLELSEKHDHIKGVVGWLDLQSEQAEEQIRIFSKHKKAVGVRHVIHDEADNGFILKENFVRGVKLLAKYDLAYDILIFPKHLTNTLQFVKQFSEKQIFVLDHIAKPCIRKSEFSPWKEDIKALSKMQNVYCKVSGMVTEADWNNWKPEDIKPYLDVIFEAFGVERIMIGSDWPVCLVAGEYSNIMNIAINYISTFSENEKALVLGENAIKAYKIKL